MRVHHRRERIARRDSDDLCVGDIPRELHRVRQSPSNVVHRRLTGGLPGVRDGHIQGGIDACQEVVGRQGVQRQLELDIDDN